MTSKIGAKALQAAAVAGCVLVAGGAHAHPYGDYHFLQAITTFSLKEPVVVHQGKYDDDLLEAYVFDGGNVGVALSFAHDETRDLNGNLSSNDTYAVQVNASAPTKKHRNETHLGQFTKFRKCSDSASLTLTITQLFIRATDGGPRARTGQSSGDYFVDIEPANKPQLVGSVEMQVIAYNSSTLFFHKHGILALNLFVDREGDERWKRANFSLANSGGDFWRGAQLEFDPAFGGLPPVQVVKYGLTAPHRIQVDLSSVPTAATCPAEGEPPPSDETGEFTLLVKLRARAETYFFSGIEQTGIEAWIRDPADLDNNEAGVIVDVQGLQRAGEPDLLTVPEATELVPDPDCLPPSSVGASHE